MRGHDEQTTHMFSYLSPEQRVPADHPLRAVRALTDEALQTMSRRFASLYATTGRPSLRAVSTSLRQPGSAFTVATPRHRRGATTTDRAAVAAGQRPHAASRPGCRSSVLGHPGGLFSTAD